MLFLVTHQGAIDESLCDLNTSSYIVATRLLMRDEKMKSGNIGSRGSLDRSSFFRSEIKMSEVTYIAVSSRK